MEYRPTKIVIESDRIKSEATINDRYSKYLKETFDIDDKRYEAYQIALKRAKKLGHKKFYTSDASADGFGMELYCHYYEEDACLKKRGKFEKTKRYDYQSFNQFNDSQKQFNL